MKRIVLYTMEKCPHCLMAKKYLDENNIPYRLCNVKTPKGQKELAATGMRGVPLIKIGDQMLKGFSVKGFNKLYKNN